MVAADWQRDHAGEEALEGRLGGFPVQPHERADEKAEPVTLLRGPLEIVDGP